ncbi:MAG: YciI family protein [Anaerolineales bacterium]
MAEFIYLIHPYRHEYFENPTAQEEAVMEAHFKYLEQAASQGEVLLAGPCLDETFGVVVIRSENEQAARAFMMNDPAVKDDVMMAELHPMRVSVRGAC